MINNKRSFEEMYLSDSENSDSSLTAAAPLRKEKPAKRAKATKSSDTARNLYTDNRTSSSESVGTSSANILRMVDAPLNLLVDTFSTEVSKGKTSATTVAADNSPEESISTAASSSPKKVTPSSVSEWSDDEEDVYSKPTISFMQELAGKSTGPSFFARQEGSYFGRRRDSIDYRTMDVESTGELFTPQAAGLNMPEMEDETYNGIRPR